LLAGKDSGIRWINGEQYAGAFLKPNLGVERSKRLQEHPVCKAVRLANMAELKT
jgi:hypothetical protein